MLQRFLDPATLASISGLDLVAKTVVDGFVAGLHRSPDFGFSQEFAEYRAYSEGDDLRHVDWNVFARTDKCFLKKLPRRDEHPVAHAARYFRLHGIRLALPSPSSITRASWRLRSATWPTRSATPPASSSSTRTSSITCAPSTRQGQTLPPAPRHREGRTRHAHRFRQAVRPFPEFSAPARHRGGAFGFLRDSPRPSSRPSSRCAFAAMR